MSAWACGLHFAVGIPCSLNRNGKGRFLLYTSPQPYLRSWIGEQLSETNMMPRTLFHEEHPIDAVVRIVAQCAILCTNSCSLVDDFVHGWMPRAQMHAVHGWTVDQKNNMEHWDNIRGSCECASRKCLIVNVC